MTVTYEKKVVNKNLDEKTKMWLPDKDSQQHLLNHGEEYE